MKSVVKVRLITILIAGLVMLYGCSNKNNLVGVYRSDSLPSAADTIILYKDGSCQYLENENATWYAKGDIITISIYRPEDTYFLDIYFNDSTSSSDIAVTAAMSKQITNVEDAEYIESNRSVRVRLSKADDNGQIRDAIAAMRNVNKIQEYILESGKSEQELKVADNCLVLNLTDGNCIFVKVSS